MVAFLGPRLQIHFPSIQTILKLVLQNDKKKPKTWTPFDEQERKWDFGADMDIMVKDFSFAFHGYEKEFLILIPFSVLDLFFCRMGMFHRFVKALSFYFFGT